MRSTVRIRNQGIRIAFSTTVSAAVTNSSGRDSEIAIVAATMAKSSDCRPYRRIVVNSAFCPTMRYALTSIPAAQRINTFAVMSTGPQRNRIASARNPRPSEIDTSSGTRNKRSFAFVLSTTVTAIASTNTLPTHATMATSTATRRGAGRDADRHEEIHQQREIQELFDGGSPFDQGEVRAGVLKHHRFMDHRQLEVRRGVVHGNATRLGDDNHEEPGKGENVGRMQGDPLLHERSDQHAEVHGAGGKGGRKQSQHEGGLGERGDGHVAAGAHAAEWTTGVQRGGGEREATQRQGPHQQQDSTSRFERRGREHHGHERGGGHGRGEVHARTGDIDPRRHLGSHRLLPQ